MKQQPFFSVLIPTYNRERFIKKCIDSVLSQDFTDLELIIIDDGSSDTTRNIIELYTDRRIRYYYQKNHGVSHARNRALKKASGKYICFLDSDDWWLKNKLTSAYIHIKKHPAIKIFHTEEVWYKNGKLLEQKEKHRKPTGHVYRNALPLCCISISTVVINSKVFDVIGDFDESFEACEDYDFWLRATNKYEIKLIPDASTLKDGGRPDQLSSSVWGLDRFRIKALQKMLDSNVLSKEYREVTVSELKKKCRIFALGCEKRGKTEEAEYYRDLATKISGSGF